MAVSKKSGRCIQEKTCRTRCSANNALYEIGNAIVAANQVGPQQCQVCSYRRKRKEIKRQVRLEDTHTVDLEGRNRMLMCMLLPLWSKIQTPGLGWFNSSSSLDFLLSCTMLEEHNCLDPQRRSVVGSLETVFFHRPRSWESFHRIVRRVQTG